MATLFSGDLAVHSSSSAAPQRVSRCAVGSSWIARRNTRVERWSAREEIAEKPVGRDERVDSAIELAPVEQQIPKETRLHALPARVRARIFQFALVEIEPTKLHQRLRRDELQQQNHLPPLAYALPSLANEISLYLPDYLHNNSFAFDLRTDSGMTIFASWLSALGPLSMQVQSLRLKHWTIWWGFGHSSWTSTVDTVHLTRDDAGNLTAKRTFATPANKICDCDVLQLLRQYDGRFDQKTYRGIRSMSDFIACLRHPWNCRWPLPLVEAGRHFASMLEQSSRELRTQYGVAGSLCQKCDMPKLYLCGHLSTVDHGQVGVGVTFNALEAERDA